MKQEEKYTIGQMAELCNVSTRILRYYDQNGIVVPAYRDRETNYRYYTESQIELILLLQELRNLSFPVKTISRLFVDRDLTALQAELEHHRRELQEQIAEVQAKHDLTLDILLRVVHGRITIGNTRSSQDQRFQVVHFHQRPIVFTRYISYLNVKKLFLSRRAELMKIVTENRYKTIGSNMAIFHSGYLQQFSDQPGDECGDLEVFMEVKKRQALAAGYQKTSAGRAADCLIHLQGIEGVMFLAPEGEMGGQVLTGLRLPWTAVGAPAEITTREDTLTVLRRMEALGADLIVFCGGDGTARDICEGCSDRIPVLGIPAGVKMYSGCFAVNPRTAGMLLKDYVLGKHCTCQLREVMDLDEQHLGRFSVCGKLYGYLSVLNRGEGLQGAKAASAADPFETETLAAQIISEMQPNVLYIIAPGSTTFQIKNQLCGSGTLIGVDAVCNGRIVHADADEKALLHLLEQYPAARIVVTCIGGAGFLFGRGNQQISAPVIRQVGKENIRLAVTKSKLLSLNLRPMYVDTGDPELDRHLSGYYRIVLSPQESTVYHVQSI